MNSLFAPGRRFLSPPCDFVAGGTTSDDGANMLSSPAAGVYMNTGNTDLWQQGKTVLLPRGSRRMHTLTGEKGKGGFCRLILVTFFGGMSMSTLRGRGYHIARCTILLRVLKFERQTKNQTTNRKNIFCVSKQ